MDIQTPSVPKQLRITQGMWEDFIWDPVMAAKVILGLEFDWFQNLRLRYFWFCPEVEDHSGISTGKTITDWAFAQLRAILLPDQDVGVYFPVFETGKKTFWPYYTKCKSKIFHAQLGRTDERGEEVGAGRVQGAGCYTAYYKNGNTLVMPAPSFMKDAETQASLRLNTLLVEEWTSVDASSDGIDKILTGRVTKPCWNQHHPVWANHMVFCGHAETRLHPSHVRHAVMHRRQRNGDPTVHTFGYCYKDFSDDPCVTGKSFKEEYRMDSVMRSKKLKSSVAHFLGECLGVWASDGVGWFTEEALLRCQADGRARGVVPVTSRAEWEAARR